MQNKPSLIEAKLFYAEDPVDFTRLSARVVEALARTDIAAHPRLVTDGYLAFALGGLTLSVARSDAAIDLDGADAAHRPAAAATPQPVTQRLLQDHRAAAAIRVTGPAEAATEGTRLAICYIATMQMLQLDPPELIHWRRSDTLYTLDEFCSSTGAHKPVRPARAPRPSATSATPRPACADVWMEPGLASDVTRTLEASRRGPSLPAAARPAVKLMSHGWIAGFGLALLSALRLG